MFIKTIKLYVINESHQKLNTDIKRRIDELALSDANLSDQKNADIIEHESGIIISRC
jgi:hypothetical protein